MSVLPIVYFTFKVAEVERLLQPLSQNFNFKKLPRNSQEINKSEIKASSLLSGVKINEYIYT